MIVFSYFILRKLIQLHGFYNLIFSFVCNVSSLMLFIIYFYFLQQNKKISFEQEILILFQHDVVLFSFDIEILIYHVVVL